MAHEPNSEIAKAMGVHGKVVYCGPWGDKSDQFRVRITEGFLGNFKNTMSVIMELTDLLPEYPLSGTTKTDDNEFDIILKKQK